MPVRNFALSLGLFCLCLAIVGLAWAGGAEFYLYIPTRSLPRPPPTHPGVILAFLVASVPLTYWFRQNGVYLFIFLTAGMLAGSAVGYEVFHWTPSLAQHFLCIVYWPGKTGPRL